MQCWVSENTAWVPILTHFTSCVTMDKSLTLSVPRFPYL